jgi:uncharacterized protein DUF4124
MQSLRFCFFILVALAGINGLAHADGRIVKWVDEKGITHYGDTVPPQYSGHDSSEINKQGRVVKQNKVTTNTSDVANATEAESKVVIEQKRHDRALLAAYTTEQEFDLARDRNLQTDEAAVQGMEQRKGSANDRLAANKKIADRFTQRKKPVPADVLQDIKGNEAEIAEINKQIKARQQSMEATRQRFDTDKQRFIQLKLDPNAPPPPKLAVPVATVPAPENAVAPTTPASAASETPVEKSVVPPAIPVKASPNPVAKPAATPAAPAKPKVKRVIAP